MLYIKHSLKIQVKNTDPDLAAIYGSGENQK